MSSSVLRADICFFEDWRVGSGAGVASGVDLTVLVDDDLPFVPAKSLTGVWRDAAETLARGLDGGRPEGPWQARVEELFGTQPGRLGAAPDEPPRPSRVAIRPARLPAALAGRLAGRRMAPFRAALFGVRAAVRIDPDTETAFDDHLRFEQTARRGLALVADLELDASELTAEEAERLLALLDASGAFIDNLGGGRRRGLGGATVKLESLDGKLPAEEQLISTLEASPPAELGRTDDFAPPEEGREQEAAGGSMELLLELTSLSPLLLAPKVTGNVHVGSDRIGGSHLLGIVCAAIDEAAGATVAERAVARGELVVGAATPLVGAGPGQPMPACLARFKDGRGFSDPDGVRNAFADAPAGTEGQTARQLKGLRNGYVGPLAEGHLPERVTPARVTRVHGVVEDQAQRPTQDSGLYSYSALPAGERLAAPIRLTGALAASLVDSRQQLLSALSGTRRVGRSKKDDYGAVAIAARTAAEPDGDRLTALRNGDRLSVWLLDHVVLRSPTGAPQPTIDGLLAEFEARLAGADGSEQPLALTVVVDAERGPLAAIRPGRIESWHAGWGLPRETICTLAPGGCAILEITEGSIGREALRDVEQRGIGERTAEGFGQVRFADPLLVTPLAGLNPAPTSTGDTYAPGPPPLDEGTRALGLQIEDSAWNEQIARAALLLADSEPEVLLPGTPPPASQLGNLRDAVADARGAGEGLRAWLGQGGDKAEKRQLARGWSAKKRERLASLAEPASNAVWDALESSLPFPGGFFVRAGDEPLLVRRPSELRRVHHDRALLSAIDALTRALVRGSRPTAPERSEAADGDG